MRSLNGGLTSAIVPLTLTHDCLYLFEAVRECVCVRVCVCVCVRACMPVCLSKYSRTQLWVTESHGTERIDFP